MFICNSVRPAAQATLKNLSPYACRGLLLGLFLGFCHVSALQGQFMLSPVGVSEAGLGTFSTDFGALTNIINQSGIKVPFVSGSTDFDAYFAPPNSNFSKNADRTKWQSEVSFKLPFGGSIDLDLGSPYSVSKIAIWNISVKNLKVMIAPDAAGPWGEGGAFTLSDQQGSVSLRAAVLDLAGEHLGRYVRLSIESEYPALPTVTFGYVTIGEVVVRATGLPTVTLTQEANGDLTVHFTGTLQSMMGINGIFTDVAGSPVGSYTISREAQQQNPGLFFRARN